MAQLPNIEELAKDIAQKALDTEYKGKTIREWIDIVFLIALYMQEPKALYFYDAKTGSYIPISVRRSEEAEESDIIRCKDCKAWDRQNEGYCPIKELFTAGTSFCNRAERREE